MAALSNIIALLSRCCRLLLIVLITGIRPFLGPAACIYGDIGCTQFACIELQEKPLLKALSSIVKRIAFCNPLGNFISRKRHERKRHE